LRREYQRLRLLLNLMKSLCAHGVFEGCGSVKIFRESAAMLEQDHADIDALEKIQSSCKRTWFCI